MWASMNYVEIEMTRQQALSCSHQGDCDADVEALLQHPKIKRQFKKIATESIRKELADYGAWSVIELMDNEANQRRILWIAACNIKEGV